MPLHTLLEASATQLFSEIFANEPNERSSPVSHTADANSLLNNDIKVRKQLHDWTNMRVLL